MERKCEICLMGILVIAATKSEIAPFAADCKGVEILVTGVGVPATLYHLQKKLQQTPTDLVIQAGIAGSYSEAFDLGDVVPGKSTIHLPISGWKKKITSKVFSNPGFLIKMHFLSAMDGLSIQIRFSTIRCYLP
jgi:hypothetical protein